MKKFWFLYIFALSTNIAFSQNAWINEFHYDNAGTDVGEFIEIVIENPGSYSLIDFQVDLYNGNGGVIYGSGTIDTFTVGSTSGNYTFYYWDLPTNGLQNGPDGIALSYTNTLITDQFLSYEGTVDATEGPANGLTSTDIGVSEASGPPIGYSLQLGGTGTQYSNFTWNDPAAETKGSINNGQTLSSGAVPSITVTPSSLSGFSYVEGSGPSSEQSFDISGSDLTADILITPPTNYEISTGTGGSFVPTNPITLTQSGGTVSSTPIYVRLKAGLSAGAYNGEDITATSTGATNKTVTCNGAVIPSSLPNAWINELHYDNFGGDVGEFVEIVIENPGTYTLSDFQVNLYNGSNGTSYDVETVHNFTVGSTSGNYTFYFWEPSSIQNGSPDGLALSYLGTVITGQFLSYEGTFTAVGGPADGVLSTDIGVFEPGGVDSSLQLSGTGTQYSDFIWNDPADKTLGTINNGQTLSSGSGPIITVTPPSLSGFSYLEGGGPSASQNYDLSGSDLTPTSGDITVTGSTNYEISLNDADYSGSVNVGYTGGTLASTTIYVRLIEGLLLGEYNETISNEGGGATAQNVLCNGAVVKPEPTSYATSFTGVLGNPAYYYVNLSWIDATGGTEPDGYLVKRSDIGFGDIVDPVDGVPETNTFSIQNVAQGIEAAVFTGFASTTYYFKIYPYTNEGSFIDYKLDGTVPEFSITSADPPALPLTENFEYPTGSFLTDDGWVAHSGAGGLPIDVNISPLTYDGYLNSGLGKSVTLVNPLGSFAEDVNRLYESVSSISIYASFMVNITYAYTEGIYFFHFGPENSTSLFYGKVYVINDGSDNIAFGVSKNSNAAAEYTPFDYSLNETYLVVVKYTFNEGTTDDDEVKLWINPVLDGIEPTTSDVTQTDTQTDALKLDFIALRQASDFTSGNGPELTIGGLRVATTWVPEAGASTFAFDVDVTTGWNLVSAPGTNPAGMGVLTWWPNQNLSFSVYKFDGVQYLAVTDATPTEGYWMNNSGIETYSYSDIEIVPNDPIIPVATGWNIIGGYDTSPTIVALKAANPQISGLVYGFDGVIYIEATNLLPGYGYWVFVTTTDPIVIPSALTKGSGEVVEYFKEDWGRITLTDAAGKSYTLYAVTGEVDLNQYRMPPLPPSGSFDIRFSSGRIAEDINSSMQTIDMTGVTYPLTVRVDGMDIRLQDATGSALNVSLKSGEDVVIGDATVQKLMVSSELIPTVYALEQNYPNPFNPSTVIEFSLPEDVSNVKLSIYNALGEKVAEIVNSSLTAGKYQYQWNAQNVATGMYIYELRADKFVSVKKMLLLK